MKLDFEIAVDQQTRARDRTFEGVPGARGTATPIFGKFVAQFLRAQTSEFGRQIFLKT